VCQHQGDPRRRARKRTNAIKGSWVESWKKTRLRDGSANEQATTRTTLEREVCFTGVMTEARESERSDLDTGEVGDWKSEAPVDGAMDMTTAATPTPAETEGATMFEPMERNENGKRRTRSQAPATPTDRSSSLERAMRQHAQELTQLD